MPEPHTFQAKTAEIKRLTGWLSEFCSKWEVFSTFDRFPEKEIGEHHLSMMEDTARQIATIAAEIQELKKKK